jgi:hypothetical protein
MVGLATNRPVNLHATSDDPDCFTRVASDRTFVPEAIQREAAARAQVEQTQAARLEAALPLPVEHRVDAALTGGVAYLLASFLVLGFTSGTALTLAPVILVAATAAAYALVSRPSPALGTLLFLGVAVIFTPAALLSPLVAALVVGVSALTGGYVGSLLHEQRSLYAGDRDDPRHARARARGIIFGSLYERGRMVLAGGVASALAWSPAAFTAKGDFERGAFVSFAVVLAAVASTLLLRWTTPGEDRTRSAKRGAVAFAVVAAIASLSYWRSAPGWAVLGVLTTIAAGFALGRRLPSVPGPREDLPLPPVRYER